MLKKWMKERLLAIFYIQFVAKLGSIDKIDREKVLSYDIIDNKRVLKMQYVLIEDIAI